MDTLEQIKAPLMRDMELYDAFIKSTLTSSVPYVKSILEYVIANRGKGIRPILVLLSASIHSRTETLGKRAYLASMLVEMIHTASLIHDDVVDEAAVRHGKPSINNLWGSKVSVLMGDFILAKTFTTGMSSGQYDLVDYIIGSIGDLCEGELMQSDLSNTLKISTEDYFDIIFRKTATLIGISCGVGALAAGAGATAVGISRQIGINLGMAFQIKDDILDYAPERQTGKPTCADLHERKITLPLLCIMERSKQRRDEIVSLIDGIGNDPHNNNIELLSRIAHEEGGIASAEVTMNEYLDSARSLISSYPASAARTSLFKLCDFIGRRDK